MADEIAYNAHDLDDGLTSGLLTFELLGSVPLWTEVCRTIEETHPGLTEEQRKNLAVRRIIDAQCTDLIASTAARLAERRIRSPADVRACRTRLVAYSAGMARKNAELKRFLFAHMYRHYKVLRMEEKAVRTLTFLFDTYRKNFEMLPSHVRTQGKAKADTSQVRVICDYIAGMTDRFALEEYKKLTDPFERV